MKRFLPLLVAALVVSGGLALFLWQKETTSRLQRELAARREAVRDLQRLRGENQRLRELLAAPDDPSASEALKTEIARLQQELTTLESKRPPARPRTRPAVHASPVQSAPERSEEKDIIRVADFKNVGQATPGAAFQTFIWAVAQDELAGLRPLLHLSPAGQEALRKMWNDLPVESRTRFKEPEQIIMMLLVNASSSRIFWTKKRSGS
jgi:hypothetical protein